MQTFVQLGEFGERHVVLERVTELEGLMEERGGHILIKKDGKPRFVGTRIGMDDGSSRVVPQTPAEVLDRFLSARDAVDGA